MPVDEGAGSAAAARAQARRDQAEARREALLQAARDVFTQHGYKDASVKLITDRADAAHGTFYLYFRNKEDAFIQVLSAETSRMLAQAAASWTPDPWVSARQATADFLDVFVQHPDLWRALLEAILLSPAIKERWAEIRDVFALRVDRNLRREQEAGRVRPLDTAAAAHALVSMVEWYAFTHFCMQEPAPSTDAASVGATADLLTDLWIHAVYGRVGDVTLPPEASPAGARAAALEV